MQNCLPNLAKKLQDSCASGERGQGEGERERGREGVGERGCEGVRERNGAYCIVRVERGEGVRERGCEGRRRERKMM